MSNTQDTTSPETTKTLGQVKWFNNKAGYGFITINDGTDQAKDVFIHYSSIRVTNSQYKYLVQGEYVEFDLETSTNEKYEFQANNITGLKGGKLMCETRNRPPLAGESGDEPVQKPFRRNRILPEGQPEDRPAQDDEFTTVQRRIPMGGRGGRGGRGRGGREQPAQP
jgi:cold shock CspA family protein